MKKAFTILSQQERIVKACGGIDIKSYLMGVATGLYRARILTEVEYSLYLRAVEKSNY